MRIKIAENVAFRDLSGESVLLNLSTGVYFGLNPVGTRIWSLLREHGSTEKTLEALLEEYDVEEGRLRADLDDLVRRLAEKGLVSTGER